MAQQPLVLCVDDEAGIVRLIRLELTEQGFRVATAGDAEEAMKAIETEVPDMVLLDVMMPGMSGLELLRVIRDRWPIPIIMVTARDREAEKVQALELGADDYVVKPFGPEELGARIRAILRRAAGVVSEDIVRSGEVEVDLGRRLVTKAGVPVIVTRTEWALLSHLASNANKFLLFGDLLAKIWGPEYREDRQFLRVWVSRLRSKLEPDRENPSIILTRGGVGYMFATDENQARSTDAEKD